jgi:hypothetical protein
MTASPDPNLALDLDRAQYDTPLHGGSCAVCAGTLLGSYFEANGRAVCEACADRLLHGDANEGTAGGRAIRAAGAGAAAAFAGALLYWVILAASGYEFALIAIIVGVAVGRAVSWGSYGRGGWRYQTLAMALTYLSIVSAYVPLIIKEAVKDRPSASAASASNADQSPVRSGTAPPGATGSVKPIGLGGFLLGIAVLLLFACALPLMGGLQNVLGLFIIGIGVYQAWKINRRRTIAVTGPHALASSALAGP